MPERHGVVILGGDRLQRLGVQSLLRELPDIAVQGEASAFEKLNAGVDPAVVLVLGSDHGVRQAIERRFPEAATIAVTEQRNGDSDSVELTNLESSAEGIAEAIRRVISAEMQLDPHAPLETTPPQPVPAEDQALLRTKLHRPNLPDDVLSRPYLIERLNAERVRPLLLISAAAGFGKSLLGSQWLESLSWDSCWLSLDEDDGELRTFVRYLIAALRTINPEACTATADLLMRSSILDADHLARSLANDLDEFKQPFLLALDDYHRISSVSPVHELIDRLLRQPPITLHLLVISRRDPPLSLARLRATGQIAELRMRDLAFSGEDSSRLITHIARIALPAADLGRVQQRIEGWPVALRLLALAIRRGDRQKVVVRDLLDRSLVVDEYLVNELLDSQSQEMQQRLLETSILDRFNAPLCDALHNGGGDGTSLRGEEFLSAITAAGLPLVSLGDSNDWLRYHHTLQVLLHEQLQIRVSPGRITTLHLSASRWFAATGLIPEAIKHALAAGNGEFAATIVESNFFSKIEALDWQDVQIWLEMLPTELKETRTDLICATIYCARALGRWEEVGRLLAKLEALPEKEHSERLRQDIRSIKGGYCQQTGAFSEAIALWSPALDEVTDNATAKDGGELMSLCIAFMLDKRLEEGIKFTEAMIERIPLERMGFHAAAQAGVLHLHLGAADHPQLQHLASATKLEQPLFGPRLRYRRACSYLQTWELDEASCDFDLVLAHASHLRSEAAFDAHAGKVLTHELQGDRRDADREFRRLAELVENLSGKWETDTLASLSSRRALLRGDLSTALVWARDYDEQMHVAELLTYIESTAMTRARVLAASEHADDWNLGLEGLKSIAEKCGFIPAFGIQITALRAMLEYRRGNTEQAVTALSDAIELARPGGTLLPFVEPGLRMQALFDDAAIGLVSDDFVTRIRGLQDDFIHRMSSSEQTDTEPAADLTNREMDILTLLAERLQNKEIAARLFVSPETVKTHLKNLYQKLGVRSRREAVAQAGELLRSN